VARQPQMDEAIAARPSGVRIHCARLHPTDRQGLCEYYQPIWADAAHL
jgi:hypothetical protein